MVKSPQTECFWREIWHVSDDDIELLLEVFLEQNRPLTAEELAREYLRQLVAEQKQRQAAAGAELYDPTRSYAVGTRLSFPQLDGAIGEVVDTRAGYNPRYDEFTVLAVRFDDGAGEVREFAADFRHTYALNFDAGTAIVELSPEELDKRYGKIVAEKLSVALEEDEDFIHFGRRWLPKVLLVEANEGNLNIAEAMIDVTGKALPTSELMKEMDLPENVSTPILEFAVNLALAADDRFINSGADNQPLWGLQAL